VKMALFGRSAKNSAIILKKEEDEAGSAGARQRN
jgi:hypothetical protein